MSEASKERMAGDLHPPDCKTDDGMNTPALWGVVVSVTLITCEV